MTYDECMARIGQEVMMNGDRVKILKASDPNKVLVYVSKVPGPTAPIRVSAGDLSPLSS